MAKTFPPSLSYDADYDVYALSMHKYLAVPTLTPSLVHVFTPPRLIYSISNFLFVMSLPCSLPFLALNLGLPTRSLFKACLIHTVALDTAVGAILSLYSRIDRITITLISR